MCWIACAATNPPRNVFNFLLLSYSSIHWPLDQLIFILWKLKLTSQLVYVSIAHIVVNMHENISKLPTKWLVSLSRKFIFSCSLLETLELCHGIYVCIWNSMNYLLTQLETAAGIFVHVVFSTSRVSSSFVNIFDLICDAHTLLRFRLSQVQFNWPGYGLSKYNADANNSIEKMSI